MVLSTQGVPARNAKRLVRRGIPSYAGRKWHASISWVRGSDVSWCEETCQPCKEEGDMVNLGPSLEYAGRNLVRLAYASGPASEIVP